VVGSQNADDRDGGGQPQPAQGRRSDQSELGQVHRLARGSAILVSTGVISYAGNFVLSVVLARTLGALGFGLWAIAFSLTRVISIVGLFGADWLVLRQGSYYEGIGDLPRMRRTIHVALGIGICGLSALAVALFVAADPLAEALFEEPRVAVLLRITAVMAPIIGVRQILVYATQAFKEMKDAAIVRNVLQPLVRLVFAGGAGVIYGSVEAAFIALLVSEILLCGVAAVLLHRRLPLLGPVADVPTREFIGFAMPAWLTRLAGQTRSQVLTIMLGSLATIVASGVLSAADRIAASLFSIVSSLNQVYTPIASDLYLQQRRDEWIATYRSATKWTFALGAPLLAFIVVFPAEILSIFGEDFREGSSALVILGFGLLFHFGTGPVTVTLVLIGKPRLALIDYIVVIAIELGLGVWLIPRYGLVGAAIAKAVGTAANNVLPLLQVWFAERALPFRWDFWKPALAAIVSAGIAKVVVLVLPLGGGVGAAVVAAIVIAAAYVGITLLLGLPPEDRVALQAFRFRRGARTAVAAVSDDAPFVAES
jgi:O-antigen/teichoic acid export membrane protein